MKKDFMIFAAALIAFAACQEEMTPEINTTVDEIMDYPVDITFVASNETGTKTVIIAYPATVADMSTVIDTGAMNTPIQKAHDFTVDVEGANGYAAASYKVWLYNFADGASADNTYEVTI